MEDITEKKIIICVENKDKLETVRNSIVKVGIEPKIMKTTGSQKCIIYFSEGDKALAIMKLINEFKDNDLIIWHGERR